MAVSLWIYAGIFLVGVIVIALVGSHSARRQRRSAVPGSVPDAPQQAGFPLGESGVTFGAPSMGDRPGPPAAPVPPRRAR